MSLLDRFLAVLTPYECLGCTAEGSLLCLACTQQLTTVPARCYRCLVPAAGSLICPNCAAVSNLHRLQAGTLYEGVAKELVGRLKFAGAQAAARHMATRLIPFVDTRSLLVMPVPTASSRVRGRGYDQAKLLARELNRQARLPYLDCLVRSGNTHQVGSSRRQRMEQLREAFRVSAPEKIRGQHILLIDDVVTSGATLEAAAHVLRIAGAKRVEAAVFCAA
jgi:ComF family protein